MYILLLQKALVFETAGGSAKSPHRLPEGPFKRPACLITVCQIVIECREAISCNRKRWEKMLSFTGNFMTTRIRQL